MRRTTPSPSSRACSSAEVVFRATLLILAFGLVLTGADSAPRAADGTPLLSRPYPIYAAPSFSGAVFHWIDSLAGTSEGKTVPAHRAEFVRRFGHPTEEDRRQIGAFLRARRAYLEHLRAIAGPGGAPRAAEMLRVFCAAPSVEAALAEIRPTIPAGAFDDLSGALGWFRPKYEKIWNDGAVPKEFLARVRHDRGLRRLSKLLARVAAFYGVDPSTAIPPRLALVPVPPGYGTHAEEVGNILLLEIRPGDDLAEEATVIVHENAHWLYSLVPDARKKRLERIGASRGPAGRYTYALLAEAIPTALGQGVAGRAFEGRSWSTSLPWYHLSAVDACAKAIYPRVRKALATGGVLDASFVENALETPACARPRAIPRSP